MKSIERYRQTHLIPYSTEDEVRVGVGKYCLTHKGKTKILKTHLGSCVGLVGYLDGYGFMTHIKFHRDTPEMFNQLRWDIQREVGCILEDFHLTLSGGNHTIDGPYDIGGLNIESVLKHLGRKPNRELHIGNNGGNSIQLDLISGQVTSTL